MRIQMEVTNAQNEYKRLNKYIEDNTIRLCNKGDYSKIKYVYSTNKNMAEDKKNYAKEITIKSFNMYVDCFNRAKYIKEQLESRYNGKWCVNIKIQNYGFVFVSYYDSCYIKFDIGEYDSCFR